MKSAVQSIFFALTFFCLTASCTKTKYYAPVQPLQQMYACVNYSQTTDPKGICVENNRFLRSDQRDLIAILYEIKKDKIPLRWIYVDVQFEPMKAQVKIHNGNGKVCAEETGETFEDVMQKVALMNWGQCGDKSPPIFVPPTNHKSILYVNHSGFSSAVVFY